MSNRSDFFFFGFDENGLAEEERCLIFLQNFVPRTNNAAERRCPLSGRAAA